MAKTGMLTKEEYTDMVNAAISHCLTTDIAPFIIGTCIPEAVENRVYDAYTPVRQPPNRRGTHEGSGGIGDPYNTNATVSSVGSLHELEIETYADPQSRKWRGINVADYVESGVPTTWMHEAGPRPFVQEAIDDNVGEIEERITFELLRQGLLTTVF